MFTQEIVREPSFTLPYISVLVPVCQKHKHLGVQINNRLSWSDHVDELYTACARKIGMLRFLRKRVLSKCLTKIYIGYIRPRLEYARAIWSGGSTSKLCRLHERFCRRHQARLASLEKRFKYLTLVLSRMAGLCPIYLLRSNYYLTL